MLPIRVIGAWLAVSACTATPVMVASEDPSLSAKVLARRALRYDLGEDPELDRPAHVRGASALQWLDGKLAVVQDDTNFIALAEPTGAVDAVALPVGHEGRRIFEKRRGNKDYKWDLEAAMTAEGTLLAFGSGSKRLRERIVTLRGSEVIVREAGSFYEMLRTTTSFSGSELNLEGVAWLGDGRVRFFQRGNGAPSGDRVPVNAIAEVSWTELSAYLEDPATRPPPLLENIRQYDLGSLDGVPLTFTDGVGLGESTLFLAAAEASPDAAHDGPVAGVVVGVIDVSGEARWTRISTSDGEALTLKAEGICLAEDPTRAYVVTDRDDPDEPTELLTLALEGFGP